ncbi:MAG TPA: thioredoxin domain-containing protein [Thermoanaerobaculia bacterium]|nr:thioredoxin domain-containing protein [Thermoanaerobaculia bacterium]
MKRTLALLAALVAASLSTAGCAREPAGGHVVELDAEAFSTELGAAGSAQLVDVRTPGEFARGHLAGAVNLDLSTGDFARSAEKLDRARPVFVYCLSGSRSAVAARWLASAGFSQVYDLSGGILTWRAAGLPQATERPTSPGLTRADFERRVDGETPVLVDFYAEWCVPCRKMKPELERLAAERAGSLRVERIDADDNQALLRELGVDSLPTVELYRRGERVWQKTGYTSPAEIVAQLDAPN